MRLGLAYPLVTLLLCLSHIPSNGHSVLPPDWSPATSHSTYEIYPSSSGNYDDNEAFIFTNTSALYENESNDAPRGLDEGRFTQDNEIGQYLSVGDLKRDQSQHVKLALGYLTAVKGDLKERQGLAISGAISMAIEEINDDPNILPNVTLELRWNDTKGDTVLATKVMTDMVCDGVTAFFGPEGSCYVEAIVSQARNIPMISYKCSDYKASAVPTFARTEPPDTQVTKSIVSLLSYYNWKKFSIIYEEGWDTVAYSLEKQAENMNMSVQHKKNARDRHKCCEQDQKCCLSGFWYDFIQNSKNRTRIYVFLGTTISLIDFMDTMQRAELFDKGEYVVIYVDMNTYLAKEVHRYIYTFNELEKYKYCQELSDYPSFTKRVKSLFIVVPTAPTDHYRNFSEKVREFNKREPFLFRTGHFPGKGIEQFVSIYAAYLYDSVKLYASALHHLLLMQNGSDEVVREISSNGTKIIETIIKVNQTYNSITGAVIKLDRNGDSEGNFSVLAHQDVEFLYTTGAHNFTCSFHLAPVGQFYQNEDSIYPQYKINPNTPINWAGGDKPNDEPSCGFDNQLCQKTDSHRNSIIAAGVLGVILFCAAVITMSIYRKWKIEQEIEGLLWKIDRSDIYSYFERENMISSPSRLSLGSASVTSYESRGGLQVFTTRAMYKGVVVRIKELSFSRKRDISREMMKEMRLLRDLRHDNINSFIGACIQPNSLLLVTDYCAKGSLYDIIENEDIKLDKMFVASLVHDLIKGMLYLHNSMLGCHGNLKSANCVVTSRWVLQVTDFGLIELRQFAAYDIEEEHRMYRNMLWRAPEILRYPEEYPRGSQKSDVYAFALILYEILARRSPFGPLDGEPKEIILSIKDPKEGQPLCRPDIDLLYDSELGIDEYILELMQECWSESPEQRPDFVTIRSRLKKMKEGKSKNIMDQMMDMMVKYADNLEELVNERTRLLREEKNKTEDLLHRMLPKPVAARLTKGYGIEPESFESVTIYFSDIVGFTAMSAESTPLQVVNFLNDLYTIFDRIIKGYDVYKVETIGDAYMVVSGLPIKNDSRHAGEIASMALDLLTAVKNHKIAHRPNETLKLRIGIHTGSVVAGVVGLTMPRYCLFGDAVNTASRMESNGEPLKIHISQQCKDVLDKIGGYIIEKRGLVNMKGKGKVETFWLEGSTERAIKSREVDLAELPPLFCRPRRSPKLENESRQTSVMGGTGGLNSRRHSSVPRDNRDARFFNIRENMDHQFIGTSEESCQKLRSRRISSNLASYCEIPSIKVRESKSLDPLPLSFGKKVKQGDRLDSFTKTRTLSSRSLNNCDNCGDMHAIATERDRMINNNFPNGDVSQISSDNEAQRFQEDAQVPLLYPPKLENNPIIISKREANEFDGFTNHKYSKSKLTHSLDELPTMEPRGKLASKSSFKKWFVNILNGSTTKSSHASLKKGAFNEYDNPKHPDTESMV